MKSIYIAIKALFIFSVLTGICYPLVVTGIVQLLFPEKSGGSLLRVDERIIGSILIGQAADSSIYFSPRPSVTNYNPLPSGGSNLGPTSRELRDVVQDRKNKFAIRNCNENTTCIPAVVLYASGSGLDPHITPLAALMQLERVSAARGFTQRQRHILTGLIDSLTEKPQFSLFGEERINVLLLNLATDRIR